MNWICRVILTLLLAISPAIGQTVIKYSDFAAKGNITATVQGMRSAERFPQVYPSCTITVYLTGTTTLASLYSDTSLTPLANPFTATTEGRVEFYAAQGLYDIRYSGTGITTPFTRSMVRLGVATTDIIDAGVPTSLYSNLPANPTNARRYRLLDRNRGTITYNVSAGQWVPDNVNYNVQDFGAIPGGTGGATNDTQLANVITAASAGDTIEVPAASSCYRITNAWVISKGVTITGKGTLCQTASGKGGLDIQSSNVTVKDITLQGPQYASLSINEKAIKAYAPSWASKYENLTISYVTAHTWGGYGVDAKWIQNIKVNDCRVYDIRYAGIGFSSCAKGETQRNNVSNITHTSNAYGIFFSRAETDSLITDPHSEDFDCSGNIITDIPYWEGIDTHGGVRINIHHNIIKNTLFGIQIGVSDNAANIETFPPIDFSVDGNILDSQVTNGSRGYGIVVSGVALPASISDKATGKVVNNFVRGYGNQALAGSGGIVYYSTHGLILKGNTVVEASPWAFEANGGGDNSDTQLEGNTAIDAWSNTLAVGEAGFGQLEGASNTGSVANNKLIAGTKTATYLNTKGIRYGTTGSAWRLGLNDFNATATPYTLVGTPATLTGTIEGAIVSAANDDFIQRKAGAWSNRTIAQVKTDLGIAGTYGILFGTYTDGATTINVANGISRVVVVNSSATTITNLTGGIAGQIVTLIFRDSNTTINRSNAYLAGAVNFTSTNRATLTLFFDGSQWYEVARSTTNG